MERKRYNRDNRAVPRTTKWRHATQTTCLLCASVERISECLPFAEELLKKYDGTHSEDEDFDELLQPSHSCKELFSDAAAEGGASSGESTNSKHEWELIIYIY